VIGAFVALASASGAASGAAGVASMAAVAGGTISLVGALIGGVIFRLFNIAPGLQSISISLRDVLAAFVGSLIFLAILWALRARKGG